MSRSSEQSENMSTKFRTSSVQGTLRVATDNSQGKLGLAFLMAHLKSKAVETDRA